jgi:hypothetical protein
MDNWLQLPWWRKIWVWLWYFEKSETLLLLTDGGLWLFFGLASVLRDRQDSYGDPEKYHIWPASCPSAIPISSSPSRA